MIVFHLVTSLHFWGNNRNIDKKLVNHLRHHTAGGRPFSHVFPLVTQPDRTDDTTASIPRTVTRFGRGCRTLWFLRVRVFFRSSGSNMRNKLLRIYGHQHFSTYRQAAEILQVCLAHTYILCFTETLIVCCESIGCARRAVSARGRFLSRRSPRRSMRCQRRLRERAQRPAWRRGCCRGASCRRRK